MGLDASKQVSCHGLCKLLFFCEIAQTVPLLFCFVRLCETYSVSNLDFFQMIVQRWQLRETLYFAEINIKFFIFFPLLPACHYQQRTHVFPWSLTPSFLQASSHIGSKTYFSYLSGSLQTRIFSPSLTLFFIVFETHCCSSVYLHLSFFCRSMVFCTWSRDSTACKLLWLFCLF